MYGEPTEKPEFTPIPTPEDVDLGGRLPTDTPTTKPTANPENPDDDGNVSIPNPYQ